MKLENHIIINYQAEHFDTTGFKEHNRLHTRLKGHTIVVPIDHHVETEDEAYKILVDTLAKNPRNTVYEVLISSFECRAM